MARLVGEHDTRPWRLLKRRVGRARAEADYFWSVRAVAVDEVRRAERKECPELNRTRYLWLKRCGRLTASQREWIGELLDPSRRSLKTALAYRFKLAFEAFWDLPPRLVEV